eukprot:GHVU01091880.1.p1 GENE.GHVU01091880.1~~GHVU01091880.1.p1  ORF type:complete len:223 (+),score=17.86 GHVU01091880.1:176-844(+)
MRISSFRFLLFIALVYDAALRPISVDAQVPGELPSLVRLHFGTEFEALNVSEVESNHLINVVVSNKHFICAVPKMDPRFDVPTLAEIAAAPRPGASSRLPSNESQQQSYNDTHSRDSGERSSDSHTENKATLEHRESLSAGSNLWSVASSERRVRRTAANADSDHGNSKSKPTKPRRRRDYLDVDPQDIISHIKATKIAAIEGSCYLIRPLLAYEHYDVCIR